MQSLCGIKASTVRQSLLWKTFADDHSLFLEVSEATGSPLSCSRSSSKFSALSESLVDAQRTPAHLTSGLGCPGAERRLTQSQCGEIEDP
ncbi:hypothetical protein [Luminiphilus syltensis]|uniref:hypothetical protein n=1 Tax=Luminiphilus syltensis TaxID=1341119 RepID=UPI0012B5C022|nr:hypothetical protein [Luminiphilus syltensis]